MFQADDGIRDVVRSRGLFFFQAEDGIRGLVRSRGLGDVYKEQRAVFPSSPRTVVFKICLLYTSDAADELLCVDLGGRCIIKKTTVAISRVALVHLNNSNASKNQSNQDD